MTCRVLTDSQESDLVKAYKAGTSWKKIHSRFGHSLVTLFNILKRHGVNKSRPVIRTSGWRKQHSEQLSLSVDEKAFDVLTEEAEGSCRQLTLKAA